MISINTDDRTSTLAVPTCNVDVVEGYVTLEIDSGYEQFIRDGDYGDIRIGENEYIKCEPIDNVTILPSVAREIAAALIHAAQEAEAGR